MAHPAVMANRSLRHYGTPYKRSAMTTTHSTVTAQVTCIRKSDRFNPHERIKAIGGINHDRSRWQLSQEKAIAGIEDGRWRFYVERPAGDRVWVVVAISRSGRKYLKTEADGDQPNNLLSLPECPGS